MNATCVPIAHEERHRQLQDFMNRTARKMADDEIIIFQDIKTNSAIQLNLFEIGNSISIERTKTKGPVDSRSKKLATELANE
jgi:hypothetical protein